jgi:hypothetical protein
MRHLLALALFAAAIAVYLLSVGPLFFGAPILGWVLFGAGAVLEYLAFRKNSGEAVPK